MVYITLSKNEKKSIITLFINNLSKLKIEKNDEHYIIKLNDIRKNSLNKLSKFFKLNCTSIVCISDELIKDKVFIDFLKKEKVSFFQGQWLYRFILLNLIEYIAKNKNERIEWQEVSVLVNNINENIIDMVKEIALKVKTINIITNNEKVFYRLADNLYNEYGIILNINNNYEKSLKKSSIIINYDFLEKEINKYSIYKNACILNVNNIVKINSKSFSGINVNSYNILLPAKYNLGSWQNSFNKTILYESLIYKNTSFNNIRKELEQDKIVINSLNGSNGIIRKNEYLKLTKR